MCSTANQDITLQGSTVDTGIDGFAAALKAYREGTDEVKSLVLNEMSLIYECCYCRTMFRSFPNFIAHKRRYCRSKVSALKEEKEAAESSDKGKRQSRDHTTLRQYNFIRKFSERVEETTVTLPLTKNEIAIHTLPKISKTVPVTTFRDGYQHVEGTPMSLNLAIKERVPDDRVVFITPVDRSREYGEMNLRRHRYLRTGPRADEESLDVANLSCQSPKYKREVARFASLSVLIYHLCIRHQQPVNGQFVCFLCDPTPKMRNHDLLKEHLKQVHENVRMEHIQDRKTIDPQKDLSKRFARNLKAKTVSPSPHRSISPDSADSEFEESESAVPDDDMPVPQSSNPWTESSPKKTRSQTSPPGRHRKSAYPQRLRTASPREPLNKDSSFVSNTGESILSKEEGERTGRMLHTYKGTKHGKDNGTKESSPEPNTASTGNSDFGGDDDDSPPQLERAQRNRKPPNRFKDFVVDPTRTSGGGKTFRRALFKENSDFFQLNRMDQMERLPPHRLRLRVVASKVSLESGPTATKFEPPKAALPPRPEDLTEVPVYLTEVQRDLFFSPLRPLFTNAKDGLHQCSECGVVLPSLLEGRRHMVSHIRVTRIRCTLCNAGAFFCSDMRIHLMYRHCENLHLAPEGYVTPGTAVPCMDEKKADDLSRLADPMNPGRVTFTSGKIVSCTSATPYVPDPDIEARILGAHRPKTPKKVVAHKTIPSSSIPGVPAQPPAPST